MEALQGQDVQEDNPTMVHLTTYLLALDEQYDRQASELRSVSVELRKLRSSPGCLKCSLLKPTPM
jgi:hypothetical protein